MALRSRSWSTHLTRREALKATGLIAAGAAISCTPLRYAVQAVPAEYSSATDLQERVLQAFTETVLPGIAGCRSAMVLRDQAYPFAPYAGTFAASLSARAKSMYGVRSFDRLPAALRAEVICSGLVADAMSRRVYAAAIFLLQVACYAGIYATGGCEAIDFDGNGPPRSPRQVAYADTARFSAIEQSIDGNPN